MADRHISSRRSDSLRTTFCIPNLHCPSCIAAITQLMRELHPAPIVQDVSTISHTATMLHDRSLPAVRISDLLGSAGYEVVDIMLDPLSSEKLPLQDDHAIHLEAAVSRWDPRRSHVDKVARAKHAANCQMCAAYSGTSRDAGDAQSLHSIAILEDEDLAPRYLAILSVDGMTCSSCVGTVTSALTAMSSVDRADIALVNQSASVHFISQDADAAVKSLIEAIENAGYDASLFELRRLPDLAVRDDGTADDLWQVTYSIEGMSCSSCVGKITDAVRQLGFVRDVELNLISHSGVVTFSDKENENLVWQTIEDTGHDVIRTGLKRSAETSKTASRIVSLRIRGMHCPQCPKRILAALRDVNVHTQNPLSLEDPILTVAYVPKAPELTVRFIMDSVQSVDSSFSVSMHKPVTIEERSRRMLAAERWSILVRALLSFITAIPTFMIGIVYMNLVSHDDRGYMYLMRPIHGVSRAEWATFIMATPVYFFAADYFHRRTIKEIWALWRPQSATPILKRFYRFGSMNMLVSLGCTIAYISSLAQLIVKASGNSSNGSAGQSYFDSVVFLTVFLLIGRLAEAHMKAKSGDAVAALGKLRPTVADLVVVDDAKAGKSHIERLDVDLLEVGDIFQLPHGASPPCDGSLLNENGEFDESSLTGESRVVQKCRDDSVFSGTFNKGSSVRILVTKPSGTSMLDSIIQVVREGQSRRAPMERIADMLTAYFVPVITALAILTWIIWLTLGLSGALPRNYMDSTTGGWSFWSLQFAIAVFVIACPCGLGLAAPTALFVGGGIAAQRGILVKGGGVAFQEASNLDAIIFDKTGTLTEGIEPMVVKHKVFSDSDSIPEQAIIMGILKAVEECSSHPLARAAVNFANAQSATPVQLDSADELAGKGLKASVVLPNSGGAYETLVGSEGLMFDYSVQIQQDVSDVLETWKVSGYSIILLAAKNTDQWQLLAAFAVADPIRPEAPDVVRALRARNVEVWMLSGDNISTARAVGGQIGIPPENIIASILPAEKADKVRYLQKAIQPRRRYGFHRLLGRKRTFAAVAMVGDGINDAPALAAADVGIAMASGSDVAIQSAAFVLVQSDLRAVLTLVHLSRTVFQRVVLNFFWAAIYNVIALPVAAGVLYPITTRDGAHVRLDPAWAALAMALSSITVVASSLLLRIRVKGIGFRE